MPNDTQNKKYFCIRSNPQGCAQLVVTLRTASQLGDKRALEEQPAGNGVLHLVDIDRSTALAWVGTLTKAIDESISRDERANKKEQV